MDPEPLRAREGLVEALHRSRADELDDLHRRHHAQRVRSLITTWASGWLRRPRRPVAEPLPDVTPGEVAVTYAGHASAVVRYASLTIACDPMLGHRVGAVRRATLPGLSAAELRDTDAILISHAHPDHLHLPTLRRLPRSATVVVPPGCASLISPLGFARVMELGVGHSVDYRGTEIISTPVRHPTGGGRASAGYVLRGDGPSVFFCGDSGYFSGFGEIGRRHHPEIALLPISGYVSFFGASRSLRRDHMSPLDAVFAFEDLGARVLIPIRHGAFVLSYETLDEPLDWLTALIAERGLEPHVAVLRPGGSRKFSHMTGAPRAAAAAGSPLPPA